MIEKKAYAKINLFLDIEKLRDDGYHNIKSVMQTIDWYDVIQVKKGIYEGIKITSNDRKLPTDSSNIVYRVTKAFLNELDINEGIEIYVEKSIPVSAGLAGGSADGAATLEALNELYGFPFSEDDLVRIGKSIGADIPFCIKGGTKEISGIGDIMTDCAKMPKCIILCAKMSDTGVSTPQAYKELDNIYCDFVGYNYSKEKLDSLKESMVQKNINGMCASMFNIFEEAIAIEHVSVNQIKNIMKKHGALKAMMSGSGPSVFGIFTSESDAANACKVLKGMGARAKICRPIQK